MDKIAWMILGVLLMVAGVTLMLTDRPAKGARIAADTDETERKTFSFSNVAFLSGVVMIVGGAALFFLGWT